MSNPKVRVRFAQPGEGADVSRMFTDWLGISFPSVGPMLDSGHMIITDEILQALLVLEDRSTRQPYGVLLAGPATRYAQAMPLPQLTDAVMQVAAKLSAIAVDPEHRGRGYGGKLLRRALSEYRQRDYIWMYGQFDQSPQLARFYAAHGFTIHACGEAVEAPLAVGRGLLMPEDPTEQWFDKVLRPDLARQAYQSFGF